MAVQRLARNSSFQYKGRSVDVRQIGSELNARYILEGSIQFSGTIRITAQLIDERCPNLGFYVRFRGQAGTRRPTPEKTE
jgi:TolB-like protein